MMYAVVAPGISCVYSNWKDVERIKALYPYPKWAKVPNEAAAKEWLKRNTYNHNLGNITKYGSAMDMLYLTAKYRIFDNRLCISYDTSQLGDVRLRRQEGVVVEYLAGRINVLVTNIALSDESISSHLSAIFYTVKLVGDIVDLCIELPYYSIFYCMTAYKGIAIPSLTAMKSQLASRQGSLSYSVQILK